MMDIEKRAQQREFMECFILSMNLVNNMENIKTDFLESGESCVKAVLTLDDRIIASFLEAGFDNAKVLDQMRHYLLLNNAALAVNILRDVDSSKPERIENGDKLWRLTVRSLETGMSIDSALDAELQKRIAFFEQKYAFNVKAAETGNEASCALCFMAKKGGVMFMDFCDTVYRLTDEDPCERRIEIAASKKRTWRSAYEELARKVFPKVNFKFSCGL